MDELELDELCVGRCRFVQRRALKPKLHTIIHKLYTLLVLQHQRRHIPHKRHPSPILTQPHPLFSHLKCKLITICSRNLVCSQIYLHA